MTYIVIENVQCNTCSTQGCHLAFRNTRKDYEYYVGCHELKVASHVYCPSGILKLSELYIIYTRLVIFAAVAGHNSQ